MSQRILTLAGSFAFLLIAPGTVVGLVPWLITRLRPQAGQTAVAAA